MFTRPGRRLCFLFVLVVSTLGLGSLYPSWGAATPNGYDVYQYRFSWGFIPVANLEIDFTQQAPRNFILSRGETLGLSRVIKNYSARVSLEFDPVDRSRHYELSGLDGGSKEVRKIRFGYGEVPQLLEFKDSSAPLGLEAEEALDIGSVDPLSVFAWFFTKEVKESRCNKKFRVFDGKKRFLVKIRIVEDQNLMDQEMDPFVRCRITMMASSIQSSKDLLSSQGVNFWPFNKKDQVIDVVVGIAESEASYIREIQIHSPLGKIIGRLR